MKSIKIIDIYGGVINAHTHKHSSTPPSENRKRKLPSQSQKKREYKIWRLLFFFLLRYSKAARKCNLILIGLGLKANKVHILNVKFEKDFYSCLWVNFSQ